MNEERKYYTLHDRVALRDAEALAGQARQRVRYVSRMAKHEHVPWPSAVVVVQIWGRENMESQFSLRTVRKALCIDLCSPLR